MFENLRADPRFQAIVAQVKEHKARQRALLDEMRRKGQVILRGSRPTTENAGEAPASVSEKR